ncbi:LacI family DNA-binding transcriptional regulator [Marinivivus vitaminiproducens]|uniref:LacI family DNA-binding transcriptional regulator n=1 Tax=Marinivivus vitaminiproducens TaxID=3035935 RepID=UPI00279CA5A7|nr:substrate-binding domain-containing protein [Geminicoccaceae bacterium SCSIO 64248]
MARVTIQDVAQAAGVGIATVSRVAHGHASVTPALRERVTLAMAELGYEPDPAAQSMRTRSSRTIACAIRDIAIPEFGAFVRAAEAVTRAAGYTLILTNTDETVQQELDLVRLWTRRRVDGLLTTKSADQDPSLNAALEKAALPVVLIDRDASDHADAVTIDHRRGMRAAVDYLVFLGHEHIAFLTGSPATRPGRERLAAFQEAMSAHGLPVRPELMNAQSFYAERAFHHASLILGAKPAPTAIIAGGMALLSGVLRAVRLRGLVIGQDISVIAGCDSDLAELATPAITAIRWDIPAWGRISAQLLLDRIAAPGTSGGRQILLPTELVTRSSCSAPGRPR